MLSGHGFHRLTLRCVTALDYVVGWHIHNQVPEIDSYPFGSLWTVLSILILSSPIIPVVCDRLHFGNDDRFPLAFIEDGWLEWRDFLDLYFSALEQRTATMRSEALAEYLVLCHQFIIACLFGFIYLKWHQELWNLAREHLHNE